MYFVKLTNVYCFNYKMYFCNLFSFLPEFIGRGSKLHSVGGWQSRSSSRGKTSQKTKKKEKDKKKQQRRYKKRQWSIKNTKEEYTTKKQVWNCTFLYLDNFRQRCGHIKRFFNVEIRYKVQPTLCVRHDMEVARQKYNDKYNKKDSPVCV